MEFETPGRVPHVPLRVIDVACSIGTMVQLTVTRVLADLFRAVMHATHQ